MSDRIAYGAADGYGRYGILDSDGSRLLCHECGKWWQQLATHLYGGHQMTASEYRQAHGLGSTTRLVGARVRAKLVAAYEINREMHLASLTRTRDLAAAAPRSLSHRGGQWAPEIRAQRQALGKAIRARDLTPDEAGRLGDGIDLQVWADGARELMRDSTITVAALARAADISPATASQRMRRYPDTQKNAPATG